MRGIHIGASAIAGGRDIAIGFAVTTIVVLAGATLWPHTGVAGTINAPKCDPLAATSCSNQPISASISLSRSPSGELVLQTRSDALGRFQIYDLTPGRYCLFAVGDGGFQGMTCFEVTSGQVTAVHLVLAMPSMRICLAATDRIATPAGAVLITQVRPGMMVWTRDASGRRVAAPVLAVTHTPAAAGQQILRLALSDGRVVEASSGHPTVTGRRVGDLAPGDLLDGSRVSTIEELAYAGATWDLLPAGPSGSYWANDVLLRSTLGGSAEQRPQQ
jgi:hypothetical protein